MSRRSNRELVPTHGPTLVAGIGARISGCADQKEQSLVDQVDHAKEELQEYWQGPVEFRVIATTGKGEALDRPELAQIEAAYTSGELDVFIWEDLGRLVRGGEAVRLLGLGIDHGVRTIVPNDGVDTANETWESDALEACASHVAHNRHTSIRIKKKLMNRFATFGGAPGRPIAGYVVPEGAKTYDGWQIDPAATPIIREGARRLLAGIRPNCSAVADWFNEIGFPVGPFCRRRKWDGKMVRRFYSNRLLQGVAERGNWHTVKHHGSGRWLSEPNPKGPRTWPCPHLAHLDAATFDDLNARLATSNEKLGRKPVDGADPRSRVPRKRTRFPGQWGRCWYCGHQHVWGGNGAAGSLMCSGSRQWACWNSVAYDGGLAVRKVRELITAELYALDQFDAQFRALVESAATAGNGDADRRLEKLGRDEATLAHQRSNVAASLAEYGPVPLIKQKLDEIAAAERAVARERRELEALRTRPLALPDSPAALRALFEGAFDALADDDFAFGDLLRKVVPEFRVCLVRLCDGGHPLPRARVTLALDGLVPDARHVKGLADLLRRTASVDLFVPPERERIRPEAVRLAGAGLGPKAIAAAIAAGGIERPTATAVQNALALDAKMREAGLTSPYVVLREPPADYPKLRRHRNGKYRFAPLEGYEPPPLPEST